MDERHVFKIVQNLNPEFAVGVSIGDNVRVRFRVAIIAYSC